MQLIDYNNFKFNYENSYNYKNFYLMICSTFIVTLIEVVKGKTLFMRLNLLFQYGRLRGRMSKLPELLRRWSYAMQSFNNLYQVFGVNTLFLGCLHIMIEIVASYQ